MTTYLETNKNITITNLLTNQLQAADSFLGCWQFLS